MGNKESKLGRTSRSSSKTSTKNLGASGEPPVSYQTTAGGAERSSTSNQVRSSWFRRSTRRNSHRTAHREGARNTSGHSQNDNPTGRSTDPLHYSSSTVDYPTVPCQPPITFPSTNESSSKRTTGYVDPMPTYTSTAVIEKPTPVSWYASPATTSSTHSSNGEVSSNSGYSNPSTVKRSTGETPGNVYSMPGYPATAVIEKPEPVSWYPSPATTSSLHTSDSRVPSNSRYSDPCSSSGKHGATPQSSATLIDAPVPKPRAKHRNLVRSSKTSTVKSSTGETPGSVFPTPQYPATAVIEKPEPVSWYPLPATSSRHTSDSKVSSNSRYSDPCSPSGKHGATPEGSAALLDVPVPKPRAKHRNSTRSSKTTAGGVLACALDMTKPHAPPATLVHPSPISDTSKGPTHLTLRGLPGPHAAMHSSSEDDFATAHNYTGVVEKGSTCRGPSICQQTAAMRGSGRGSMGSSGPLVSPDGDNLYSSASPRPTQTSGELDAAGAVSIVALESSEDESREVEDDLTLLAMALEHQRSRATALEQPPPGGARPKLQASQKLDRPLMEKLVDQLPLLDLSYLREMLGLSEEEVVIHCPRSMKNDTPLAVLVCWKRKLVRDGSGEKECIDRLADIMELFGEEDAVAILRGTSVTQHRHIERASSQQPLVDPPPIISRQEPSTKSAGATANIEPTVEDHGTSVDRGAHLAVAPPPEPIREVQTPGIEKSNTEDVPSSRTSSKQLSPSLAVGAVTILLTLLSYFSEKLGALFSNYWKLILRVALGLVIAYFGLWLIYYLFLGISWGGVTIYNAIGMFGSFWTWTILIAYIVAVFVLWKPGNKSTFRIMSIPVWCILAIHVASYAGPLAIPITLTVVALTAVGYTIYTKKIAEEQDEGSHRQVKGIRETLMCPIHLDLLENAKTLPCQHVICEECLDDWVKSHGTLTCPSCNLTHKLPDGGVANLPNNFVINSLVDELNKFNDDEDCDREDVVRQVPGGESIAEGVKGHDDTAAGAVVLPRDLKHAPTPPLMGSERAPVAANSTVMKMGETFVEEGEKVKLKIQLYDSEERYVRSWYRDRIEVSVTTPWGEQVSITRVTWRKRGGYYLVSFATDSIGIHMFDVRFDDEHVDGSPMKVVVRPSNKLIRQWNLPYHYPIEAGITTFGGYFVVADDGGCLTLDCQRNKVCEWEEVPGDSVLPYGIASFSNQVFVTNCANSCASVLKNGYFDKNFGVRVLERPTGIAVDRAGMIYIADSDTNCIEMFRPNLSHAGFFEPDGLSDQSSLAMIALNQAQDRIIVADEGTNTITICDIASTEVVKRFKTRIDKTPVSPFGVVVDSEDNIFVSVKSDLSWDGEDEQLEGAVVVYNSNGYFLGTIGRNELVSPKGMCWSPDEPPRLVVVDVSEDGESSLMFY